MRACPILASVLIAGCAAPPPPPAPPAEPLEVLRRFEVQYSGTIDTVIEGGLLPDSEPRTSKPTADTAQVWIGTRVVRMDAAAARRLLGFDGQEPSAGGAALGGGHVARSAMHEAIDAVIASGAAEEVAAPALVVAVGRNAKTSLARQVALLRGFELEASDVRFMTDPIIEHVEVGFSIDVRPDGLAADGSMDLEVETRVADMLGPPRRVSGNLDGAAEIAIQVPLACHQRLAGTARIAAGEAIFLAGLLVPGTADVLIVFVDARGGGGSDGGSGGDRAAGSAAGASPR